MILVEEVEIIHNLLIERFGGAKGIRDRGQLLSAIARPYQTFDRIELYPDIESKAAAIIESIVINHPFIDGNKRIGYVLMQILLRSEKKIIKATLDEKYVFVISITEGKLKFNHILDWIKDHVD